MLRVCPCGVQATPVSHPFSTINDVVCLPFRVLRDPRQPPLNMGIITEKVPYLLYMGDVYRRTFSYGS